MQISTARAATPRSLAHRASMLATETKRFPPAGRHKDKNILPSERILHDLPLQWPKLVMAKMSLEWPEKLHGVFIKERACFWTANLCLSRSAFDRKYGLDLIEFAAVDGGLTAFVVERVDDHFEFAVAIQIEDRGDLVHVRSNRLIRLRVSLTGHKLRLNFPGDYASQNDDGITSTSWRLDWRLGERRP